MDIDFIESTVGCVREKVISLLSKHSARSAPYNKSIPLAPLAFGGDKIPIKVPLAFGGFRGI